MKYIAMCGKGPKPILASPNFNYSTKSSLWAHTLQEHFNLFRLNMVVFNVTFVIEFCAYYFRPGVMILRQQFPTFLLIGPKFRVEIALRAKHMVKLSRRARSILLKNVFAEQNILWFRSFKYKQAAFLHKSLGGQKSARRYKVGTTSLRTLHVQCRG